MGISSVRCARIDLFRHVLLVYLRRNVCIASRSCKGDKICPICATHIFLRPNVSAPIDVDDVMGDVTCSMCADHIYQVNVLYLPRIILTITWGSHLSNVCTAHSLRMYCICAEISTWRLDRAMEISYTPCVQTIVFSSLTYLPPKMQVMKWGCDVSEVCYLPFLGMFFKGLVAGTEDVLAECHVTLIPLLSRLNHVDFLSPHAPCLHHDNSLSPIPPRLLPCRPRIPSPLAILMLLEVFYFRLASLIMKRSKLRTAKGTFSKQKTKTQA